MGVACSSRNNLKRFFRCQKCQNRNKKLNNNRPPPSPAAEHHQKHNGKNHHDANVVLAKPMGADEQIWQAFIKMADDPTYISQRRFEEEFGPSLGPALWQYLQGEEEKTMNFEQFMQHGETLKLMPTNNYAQMGMTPRHLLRACLESSNIHPIDSHEEILFINKLSHQIGHEPEEIIAWKDKNCPRLFQSIHENVLNKFLGIPKSDIEEAKPEESSILDPVEMFFLKHNLSRAIYFEKSAETGEDKEKETGEEGKTGKEVAKSAHGKHVKEETIEDEQPIIDGQWRKLYDSQTQQLSRANFEENVFAFDGSTVCIFELDNDEIYVLAVDQQWKNSPWPFGGPFTVLFKFHPEFERIEKEPPALHCNLAGQTNTAIYFNCGKGVLTIKDDFANARRVEVWACARRVETAVKMPQLDEETEEIVQKTKSRLHKEGEKGGGDGAKRKNRTTAVDEWAQNPDKQLLEMAGYSFSDDKQQRGKKQRE